MRNTRDWFMRTMAGSDQRFRACAAGMRRLTGILCTAAAFAVLSAGVAGAGEWRVLPLGLEFKKNVRSGVFTVINESMEPVSFQVSAMDWNQDETGKETYLPARDLVYFPKIMTIAPGAQQLIRVGYQGPIPQLEKTYRLFIKEIPSAQQKADAKQRFQVAVAMQFATPIFVRPAKESQSGVIVGVSPARDRMKAIVRNTGTVHVRFDTIALRGLDKEGREVFAAETKGWYILNGKTVEYSMPVSSADCGRTSVVEVEAMGASLSLKETVRLGTNFCAP